MAVSTSTTPSAANPTAGVGLLAPTAGHPNPVTVESSAGSVASTVGSAVLNATGLGSILSPSFWLHVLELIGGAVLIFLGLRELSRASSGALA